MSDLVGRLREAGCVFAESEAAILTEAAANAGQSDPANADARADADPDHAEALERLVARRIAGEPLEHVVGWAEFAGMRIPVAPGVFVPRRRTELVARVVARLAPASGTVVDLCCGAGPISVALATWRKDLTVVAADIDPVAVDLALRALAPLGGTAVVSDMDENLPPGLAGAVDVVASCPPYVPSDQIALMPHEAREYEPTVALDGGADGARMQSRVFAAAVRLLAPGGRCVVETSEHGADATLAAARAVGLAAVVEEDEEVGAVVVIATR
jgi:release factor glutamine methyltransferase